MFFTQCWISSLFFIVVKGEINESRWATEIHTEIVTQTLFTGCDPMLDKDCSGPINRPSEYSSSNGAVEFLGVGTTRESSQGTVGEASYTTSSDSPTMDHITTRTLYEGEETPVLAAVVRDAIENQTRVKGGIIEPRVVYKECKTAPPEQSPCLTCSGVIQNPMISDEQRLFESLFKNYRKALRPLRKGSEILTVSFSLVIKDIFDVDERNQVLKMNVQLNESWVDQILHWNPEEFGGISELRIPASEIWIPDITLYNTGDSAVLAQGNITSSNVILRYDGFIRLTTKPFVQHSTCLLSIRYFPFDVQTCKLKFGSWTFDQRLVDLVNGTPGPLYSDFEQNEQWHLEYAFFKRHVLFYVCCPQRYVDVTLCMGLKRKPQYYIHKLVMPILLLSALSMVGFLMPYNVGVVKANLSISLFLSMTVFLLLVAETIPRTSSELPIVTQYYISIMILIALSTGMNIAILNIFHLGKESAQNVPRWMRRAVFFYLARIMLMEDIVAYWKKSVKRHPQKSKDEAEREAMLRRQRWFASRYGIKYNPKENVLINNLKTDSGSTESLLHDEHSHMEQEENLSEYENIDEKIPIIWRVRLKNIEGSVSNVHQHMIGAHKKRTKLQKSKREWALVATVMDRLFFIIYSTTTISVTFYILMLIPRWQIPLNVNDCV